MDSNTYLPRKSGVPSSHLGPEHTQKATRRRHRGTGRANPGVVRTLFAVGTIAWVAASISPAGASHQGHDAHADDEARRANARRHRARTAPPPETEESEHSRHATARSIGLNIVATQFGLQWYEIDPAKYLIWAFEKVRLVRNVTW